MFGLWFKVAKLAKAIREGRGDGFQRLLGWEQIRRGDFFEYRRIADGALSGIGIHQKEPVAEGLAGFLMSYLTSFAALVERELAYFHARADLADLAQTGKPGRPNKALEAKREALEALIEEFKRERAKDENTPQIVTQFDGLMRARGLLPNDIKKAAPVMPESEDQTEKNGESAEAPVAAA